MKKRTKILLAILSAAAISAGAFALAGCGSKSKQVYSETYYTEYQAYVDAKKKAKEDYLSYEEWLTLKLFEEGKGGGSGSDGTNGTNGKDGASWLTGTTAPAATVGKDGDFYLNTTTFTIYSKSGGVWTELGSIKGSDGVGDDGVGIESVEYKDGKIVIHLTNGETKEVELPSQITHIHAYNDEEVFTLIEATEETDGLGYKVCTDPDCEHLELVIISKRYIITVKDYEGNLVEGVTVVINGAKAVTDANGVATVVGYGYKNDYIISVEGKNTDRIYRTGYDPRVEIVVVDAFDSVSDQWNTYDAISREGVYQITVVTKINEDWDFGSDSYIYSPGFDTKQVVLNNDTDDYKKYAISLSDNNAMLVDAEYYGETLIGPGQNSTYEVILAPHQQMDVYFWYNEATLDPETQEGVAYTYLAIVEELEIPAAGTEAGLPQIAEAGTEISISSTTPADADGWVYYSWENKSADIKKLNFSMTNVEIEFTAKTYVEYVEGSQTVTVSNGTDFDLVTGSGIFDFVYTDVYGFRVKLAGGASTGSFTLNEVISEYTLGNPHEVDLSSLTDGKITTEHNEGEELWFKVTIAQKALFTVIQSNSTEFKMWDHKPNMDEDDMMNYEGWSPDYGLNADPGAKDVFEIEAGTYYIQVKAPYDEGNGDTFELIFRAYNASTDVGISKNAPIEITDFEEKLENNTYSFEKTFTPPAETNYYQEDVYYSFVAPKAGTVNVSYGEEGNGSYSIYVGNKETTDFYSSTLDVEEGEVVIVYIHFESSGEYDGEHFAEGGSAKFAIQFVADSDGEGEGGGQTKVQAVEHTITVQATGGTALSGVTVKLTAKVYSGDETVDQQFTAVTDSDGQVKFTFIPGRYTITLEGYGEEYYYDGASTSAASQNQTIELRTDRYTYNLTVKSGATAIGNTLVELKTASGTVVGSGTTDGNGQVEIKLFYPRNVTTLYCDVKLANGLEELYGYQYNTMQEITKEGESGTPQSVNVELTAKVAYTITVLSHDGVAVNGVTVTFKGDNKTLATETTGVNGIVTVKLVPGEYDVICTNVPAGTNAPTITLAQGTTSTTINLGVGDKAVTGGESSDANNLEATATMVVGINALTNSAEVNYYKFRTSGSGVYKFLITDKSETSYINYLSVVAQNGYDVDVLIANNGQQQIVKYGVILGVNKGVNKTCEITMDLPRGVEVVIGYSTGTGAGGQGQLTVSEGEVVKPTTVHSGSNTVTLTNGTATAVYEMTQYDYELTLTWDNDDIEITINGQPIESGVAYAPYEMEAVIVITSKSGNTASITFTFEESAPHYDD